VALLDTMYPMWKEVSWPAQERFGCGPYPRTLLPTLPILASVPRRFARYGLPYDMVKRALEAISPPPDLVMVGSVMTYWYPGVVACVRMVREVWSHVKIVVGGIYASLCHQHASEYLGDADEILRGPLEDERNWGLLWNLVGEEPPTPPSFALDMGFYPSPQFSIVMGSRGCPYRCEYCASSVLFKGFYQRELEDVWVEFVSEVERGVRDFAFYDDALLYKADTWFLPFLEKVIGLGAGVRFHTPNGIHVRYLTPEICRLMKRAGFKTLRLGLETGHFKDRLDHKLTREEWDRGMAILRETGFSPDQVGVYILFGLPGQGREEIKDSIEFVKSYGLRPHLAYYSPIPGSKLYPLAQRHSCFDLSEPLCHNNAIWPCYPGGFSWEERSRWKHLVAPGR